MQDVGSGTHLSSCDAFMEPCPTPCCVMGVASEATDQAGGSASQPLSTEPCLGNPGWGGQNDAAMEALASSGTCLSRMGMAVTSPMEDCLSEELQSLCCTKRRAEAAEGEPSPKQLKRQMEEEETGTCHQKTLGKFVGAFLVGLNLDQIPVFSLFPNDLQRLTCGHHNRDCTTDECDLKSLAHCPPGLPAFLTSLAGPRAWLVSPLVLSASLQ